MSQWDKLIKRILSLSNDLRCDELRRVLESLGYTMSAPRSGSSHYAAAAGTALFCVIHPIRGKIIPDRPGQPGDPVYIDRISRRSCGNKVIE